MVRLDLTNDDDEAPQVTNQTPKANITMIYKKAYKMLIQSLKKENLLPCVVNNLRHTLIQNKESDQVYIIFQMTV